MSDPKEKFLQELEERLDAAPKTKGVPLAIAAFFVVATYVLFLGWVGGIDFTTRSTNLAGIIFMATAVWATISFLILGCENDWLV